MGGRILVNLAWVAAAAAVLIVIGGVTLRTERPASLTATVARGVRPPAPQFRLPSFEGRTVALSDLRGKYVVVNFWASWCVPCRDEAPLLQRASRLYRDRNLVVIGVNVMDQEANARRFLAATGTTFQNVRDRDSQVLRAYGVTGLPETFFIDPAGRIVTKFPGAAIEWQLWESAIEQLLSSDKAE